ncbi:ATP-binding cassette domain-containing protein, partial [Arachidicoccus sp.]|uniref:ATP-binding cassette domain-containing protein n=1 Tax=Arachidicoccus sp. TaxID=1872624 RepID=UPI003D19AE95
NGEIVEIADKEKIFTVPKHPYTKALLACRPGLYHKAERLPVVSDFLGDSNKAKENSPKRANNNGQKSNSEILLSIRNLNTWFSVRENFFGKILQYNKAVNNVSFDVFQGENIGLVGGSGCGKTTLGRSIVQLAKPISGEIIYKGENILSIKKRPMRALSSEIQMIFQDPYASLNPKITIGQAIGEPLKMHQPFSEMLIKNKVIEWLEKVGLNEKYYYRYPHEFSGGQRQRAVIARALIMQPSFVICDECVSALDVSVQAQILNLLNDLKEELNFTSIFISHDISVVKYFCDRIIVMNNGQVEEVGDAQDIYERPQKDYTKKLLAAVPRL